MRNNLLTVEVIRIVEVLGNTGSFLVFAVDLLHKSMTDFVVVGYFMDSSLCTYRKVL